MPETTHNPVPTMGIYDIPILSDDGSNWSTYKAKITNQLMAMGLRRHLIGIAKKPSPKIGKYEKDCCAESKSPTSILSAEEIEKVEQAIDLYEQKEAQMRSLIYSTISHSTFLQVKDCPSAHEVWENIVTLNEKKIVHLSEKTLDRLQSLRYDPKASGASMRSHINNLVALRERLADTGCPISDEEFVPSIQESLSSTTPYRRLLSLIKIITDLTQKPVNSKALIQLLYDEEDALSTRMPAPSPPPPTGGVTTKEPVPLGSSRSKML
ncbi:hypothetical protein AX16_001233 [Volvariella volvacea WC 439]|nr:hypothetical protein AX16_001233 [Volvariella volvacea WC 439]